MRTPSAQPSEVAARAGSFENAVKKRVRTAPTISASKPRRSQISARGSRFMPPR